MTCLNVPFSSTICCITWPGGTWTGMGIGGEPLCDTIGTVTGPERRRKEKEKLVTIQNEGWAVFESWNLSRISNTFRRRSRVSFHLFLHLFFSLEECNNKTIVAEFMANNEWYEYSIFLLRKLFYVVCSMQQNTKRSICICKTRFLERDLIRLQATLFVRSEAFRVNFGSGKSIRHHFIAELHRWDSNIKKCRAGMGKFWRNWMEVGLAMFPREFTRHVRKFIRDLVSIDFVIASQK